MAATLEADRLNINLTYAMVKNLSQVYERISYYIEQGKTLTLDQVRKPEAETSNQHSEPAFRLSNRIG
jgi:hypothetical protein